ncbi:hypothetical protein T11_3457 [Trichinella zimbabwensis]|uniref:Uncharacterized protein n=1 Tax=Trichinella zimbabwensis TaxID=268475 RepID=A0A0V1GIK3_9BILA|nr:hypothetical protein T11_3457 [Trichinella zimbabwensis]
MIQRLRQYLGKYAFMARATRNFMGYRLGCFRIFGENFFFVIFAFFVIFR